MTYETSPGPGTSVEVAIPQARVSRLFGAVKTAIAEEKTKYAVDHVLVIIDQQNIRIQSTNGKHIAMACCTVVHVGRDREGVFLLPLSAVIGLSNCPKGRNDTATLSFVNGNFNCVVKGRSVVCSLPQGAYPHSAVTLVDSAMRCVEGKFSETAFSFPKGKPLSHLLLTGQQLISAFDPPNMVRLQTSGNTAEVTLPSQQAYVHESEGLDLDICLDREMARAAARTYDRELLVSVAYFGTLEPIVFECSGGGVRIVHVLQPLHQEALANAV